METRAKSNVTLQPWRHEENYDVTVTSQQLVPMAGNKTCGSILLFFVCVICHTICGIDHLTAGQVISHVIWVLKCFFMSICKTWFPSLDEYFLAKRSKRIAKFVFLGFFCDLHFVHFFCDRHVSCLAPWVLCLWRICAFCKTKSSGATEKGCILYILYHSQIDSFSTKRYLQRKLKPNQTKKFEPMTGRGRGVANSPLLIGFHN